MSDLETLKQMLARAGIEFEETGDNIVTTVTVERGYSGFCTEFRFNSDGALLNMGAYE